MNVLDFISDSPRTYIFQNRANKTNLGVILTLIYLIILLLLAVTYLYDFYNYERYEYSYFFKYFPIQEDRKKYKEKPEFNPQVDLRFEIQNINGEMDDNFIILSKEDVEFGENITLNVNDFDNFDLRVFYICPEFDRNCTFYWKNETNFNFNFIIYYSTKIVDFDNSNTPVIDEVFHSNISFTPEDYAAVFPHWEAYIYEEMKGIISRTYDSLIKRQNNYYFGRFKEVATLDFESDGEKLCPDPDKSCCKNVLVFKIINLLEGVNLYKRKGISIWDYLANISALGTTIFNGLCKIFSLIYSKYFDNYKIIDSILSKDIKKGKISEFNDNNISNVRLEKNLIDKDYSNNEDLTINDIHDENSENEDDKMIAKLPKLRFYDFFFNNVYSKCCKYIKKQKLIDSCDNILSKYHSIEKILYNQILFDNLIKDYHWNNPKLKSIHTNELIEGLKKYIT